MIGVAARCPTHQCGPTFLAHASESAKGQFRQKDTIMKKSKRAAATLIAAAGATAMISSAAPAVADNGVSGYINALDSKGLIAHERKSMQHDQWLVPRQIQGRPAFRRNWEVGLPASRAGSVA
jgi:hypothetical protein